MYQLLLKQFKNQWELLFVQQIDDRLVITRRMSFRRCIEAIDAACLLKLHISNVSELPINQYYKGV